MICVKHKHKCSGEYVGRPSPLGNPFVIGPHGSRDAVIAAYRVWLWAKIQERDPVVCGELRRLLEVYHAQGELTLTCWCSPQRCHADIIKAALEWRLSQKAKG